MSITQVCTTLKIKYVIREIKKEYTDPKQRIAIALSVAKKFCKEPKKNMTKTFLNYFSEEDLRKALGSKHIKRINGKINKKNMIKYILDKVK